MIDDPVINIPSSLNMIYPKCVLLFLVGMTTTSTAADYSQCVRRIDASTREILLFHSMVLVVVCPPSLQIPLPPAPWHYIRCLEVGSINSRIFDPKNIHFECGYHGNRFSWGLKLTHKVPKGLKRPQKIRDTQGHLELSQAPLKKLPNIAKSQLIISYSYKF